MTPRIGVRIPSAGESASPENLLRVARWAEALGLHGVWVSDHVALPRQPDSLYPGAADGRWPYPADTDWYDPLLSLAWIARAAPSLRLGTSVLILPLRHPVHVAKQVATLDLLTGGRVTLGVGVGWLREEYDFAGAPFERRGARADEMTALMRALWAGGPVDFDGPTWRVRGAQAHPLPVQRPVPILWGGQSDASLRRVARLGDGWHPSRIAPVRLRERLNYLRARCDETGRDFSSLRIVVRASDPLDAALLAAYGALGVAEVIVEPPVEASDLSDCRAELERVAAVAGVPPRAAQ
jgi:probable F420-dependent oxidoreductase